MKVAILYSPESITISQLTDAVKHFEADDTVHLPLFSRAHVAQAIDEALDAGVQSMVISTSDDLLSLKSITQIAQSYPEIIHVGPANALGFSILKYWRRAKPTIGYDLSREPDMSVGVQMSRGIIERVEPIPRMDSAKFAGLIAGAMAILAKESGPEGPALIATYHPGD